MRRSKPTIVTVSRDEPPVTAAGPEKAWSLVETLDSYEVKELTPAQAAKLLRERRTRQSEPGAPERAKTRHSASRSETPDMGDVVNLPSLPRSRNRAPAALGAAMRFWIASASPDPPHPKRPNQSPSP